MPFARLYYHIIWGTEKREPLIKPEFETALHNVIAAKVTELGGQVFAVGGVEDHVHVAGSIPPRIAVSNFVGQLKGNSSHFVNHVLTLPYHFAWQSEYGVVTFGPKNLSFVVDYIHHQRQHHSVKSAWAYLEAVDVGEPEETPLPRL